MGSNMVRVLDVLGSDLGLKTGLLSKVILGIPHCFQVTGVTWICRHIV
jgi:hypothetical protein